MTYDKTLIDLIQVFELLVYPCGRPLFQFLAHTLFGYSLLNDRIELRAFSCQAGLFKFFSIFFHGILVASSQ